MKSKSRLHKALIDFFKSPEGQTLMHEAVNKALMRDMTFEKRRDENNQPISPPQIKTEKVNVIDQLVVYLSRQEGAFQGVQNKIIEHQEEIRNISVHVHEDQMRVIQSFEMVAAVIQQLDKPKDLKQIA